MGENELVPMPESQRTFEPPLPMFPAPSPRSARATWLLLLTTRIARTKGDLTLAAEHVTPEAINFMARYGRGLICLTLTEERADYLRLFPMTQQNSSRFGTAFTETIEAREGVTTGISAADRAHTIRTAIDPKSTRGGPGATGTYFSAACAAGRGAGSGRTDGGFGRPRAAGRSESLRRDLRGHARRR